MGPHKTKFRIRVSKDLIKEKDSSVGGIILVNLSKISGVRGENLSSWDETETTESMGVEITHNEHPSETESIQLLKQRLKNEFVDTFEIEEYTPPEIMVSSSLRVNN